MEVSNGGVGMYKGMYNVTAAIETLGVPPRMEFIKVHNSAYNGTWTLLTYSCILMVLIALPILFRELTKEKEITLILYEVIQTQQIVIKTTEMNSNMSLNV